MDDDGDGFIDCDDWDCDDDPACEGGGDGETECDDGVDNDGDGWADCDDWDCEDDPACQGAGDDDDDDAAGDDDDDDDDPASCECSSANSSAHGTLAGLMGLAALALLRRRS